MFTAQAATSRYQPRPQDATAELFEARLKTCEPCPLRRAHTCRPADQLVTVLARGAKTLCPNRAWPGDPPATAAPPPIDAPAPPPIATRPAAETRPVGCRTIPCGIPAIAFEGVCRRKPWQYEVTAVVPTLNASERLPAVIELLRLQTVRPFVIIVDTGSDQVHWPQIETLRADDVEVHALRLNAVEHPSEPVAMAMDLATGVCRTRFLFCTHDDCFLRSPHVLKELRDLAALHKLAGHRLTPRPHDDWHTMFGHTCLMLDNDFFIDQGLTWNMRRGTRLFGLRRPKAIESIPNWPDTETGLNYLCRLAGLMPQFTGDEANYNRNVDDWIDHCRSAGVSALYNPAHHAKARAWLVDALREAWERIRDWRAVAIAEEPPLPEEPPIARLALPHFTPGQY